MREKDLVEIINDNITYLKSGIEHFGPDLKPIAAIDFMHAINRGTIELNEQFQGYVKYIKKNKKTYKRKCYDDIEVLKFMLSEKIINEKEANKLLDFYSKEENTEITAMLVDYINQIKKIESFDEFDFDKQDKILEKKIARKKELANCEGIEGVIFVATGDMKNFGSYDIYTGAHDWNDLKKFIESRGGFLRSAVSRKTDYLICNDTSDKTNKLVDAIDLGITIITEEEFLKMAKEK